jgi:hypothetical protein
VIWLKDRRILRQTEAAIRRSDPGLSRMLALFNRLTADEVPPQTERLIGRAVAIPLATLLLIAFAFISAGALAASTGPVCARSAAPPAAQHGLAAPAHVKGLNADLQQCS